LPEAVAVHGMAAFVAVVAVTVLPFLQDALRIIRSAVAEALPQPAIKQTPHRKPLRLFLPVRL